MRNAPWDRVEVTGWPVASIEPRGSTNNRWVVEPTTGHLWLHKDTMIPSNGIEQGEDWSEVVSTRVGELLGVPVAETRMCVRDGRRGSLSLSVRPAGCSLIEGSVVMERAQLRDYFPHREGRPGVDPARPGIKRPGHHPRNIRTALAGVHAPGNFRGPSASTAYDVFVGYLLLDALIANRDRHEENWAVLTPGLISQPEVLAPSYDHASSIGFNLRDTRRTELLHDPQRLRRWPTKGTASRF